MVKAVPLKNIPEKLETPYITFWKEEGIVHGKWADKIEITLDIAKYSQQERLVFTNGIAAPFLADIRGVRSVSKEAREYFSKEGTMFITAGAMIINSELTKALANFFLLINRPPIPMKLFTDETNAKEWLKQYL